MTLKQGIVAELGGTDLLVPDLIARSLQANDQIKYYFALLQTARSNADQPRIPAPDLRTERVASKVADTSLDNVIATTKRDLKHAYSILHAVEIFERIKACMADMLACLPAVERGAFENRVQKLKPPIIDNGCVSGAEIDATTSGNRGAGDSLHLIVMDAHRTPTPRRSNCMIDAATCSKSARKWEASVRQAARRARKFFARRRRRNSANSWGCRLPNAKPTGRNRTQSTSATEDRCRGRSTRLPASRRDREPRLVDEGGLRHSPQCECSKHRPSHQALHASRRTKPRDDTDLSGWAARRASHRKTPRVSPLTGRSTIPPTAVCRGRGETKEMSTIRSRSMSAV